MQRQFGTRLESKPDGFATRITFPVLARTDTFTGDGRRLESLGADVVNLPTFINFLDHESEFGHLDAVNVGRLDVVTFHDDGTVSGEGWLADDEMGKKAAKYVKSKRVKGNSVDLRDVSLRIRWPSDDEIDAFFDNVDDEGFSGEMPKILRSFSQWKIGGTTLVSMPAFEDAYATVEEDEEVTAAFEFWSVEVMHPEEVTAAVNMLGDRMLPAFADFHMPEPKVQMPLTVTEDGHVYGHLGVWGTCHRSMTDACMMINRSLTGYASYNSSSVLTDNGLVRTGPIALYRGHVEKGLDPKLLKAAYEDPANAWADVRIIDGQIGPWMSGRVRPGTSEIDVYAARASRVSGHWRNGDLLGICSVSVPAFEVAYVSDGDNFELVAAFDVADCGCDDDDPFVELGDVLKDVPLPTYDPNHWSSWTSTGTSTTTIIFNTNT